MTVTMTMKSANEHSIQYAFTYQDAVEVLRLVRDSESCESLDLAIGDIKLSLTRARTNGGGAVNGHANSSAMPVAAAATRPAQAAQSVVKPAAQPAIPTPQAAADAAEHEGLVPVRTPTLGVFYRASSPDVPAFVKEGDVVKAEDQVGLLEVMKLFSPVTAGVSGRVVKILVADNVLVEHGQTLMLIQPD